jgi:hypothetical protein
MGYRDWSKEDREKIYNRYLEGESFTDIAKSLCLSRDDVKNLCQNLDKKQKQPEAKVENQVNWDKYSIEKREEGRELWAQLLDQGGLLHPEYIEEDFQRTRRKFYIVLRAGVKREVIEKIKIGVAGQVEWDTFNEEEQLQISWALLRQYWIIMKK